jgi:hypothetical protein
MQRLCPIVAMLLLAGCSGRPGRLSPPKVSADAAADEALETFDQNQDGSLAEDELAKCPGLAHVFSDYDSNGDKQLSGEEIAAGIRVWAEGKMGMTSWPFQVRFNGRPLEGAQVKLIPEPFLGDAIKPASGEAGRGGHGSLGIALEELPSNAPKRPLIQPGIYRVEITHPSTQIPAQYNTESTIGLEVAAHTLNPGGFIWNLTSGK